MKILKISTLLIAFALITINVKAQDATENLLAPRAKMNVAEVQGTVTSIVKETREITLIGERGELTTFVADDAIERFDEIAVGDVITAEYVSYLSAEFRKPTPEELAEPLVIVADAEIATKDMDPGAAVGAMIKAVVTIEVIDRPYMLVVVKGPNGNYATIEAEDADLLGKLHVGQVVILTYAEAIAVTLTKVSSVE